MKLYIYDHCPFCVRARMIFGLRGLPVELEVFANDDEAGPTALIGEKVVPILVKPDGTAMDESLDIVRFVDEYAGKERLDDTIRPEIQAWLEKVGKYANKLIMPRSVQIGLPEFASASSRAYYIEKKTAIIGDFAENIARTSEYLAQLHADLPELAALIHSEAHIGERLGYEDIITFPLLRNLTMVKGLQYPEQIRFYVERMAKQSGVPLYYDKAV
ncbi:glutaredoxin 2 [uncultured Cardiobacterium sp.]|uniref:glutaredoxin 2 n=1 Tax=uncultured Cardiobacterium sp. TaxID=417619 RepID=UPI00261A67B9|nr:glutaredoxin 2 [uncultured Cardiobacterium sp.]